MAGKTDFLAFYQNLGVSANCSLDELKRAYRRRVAVLHPDRYPDRKATGLEALRLQELTACYDAVMSFQRSHGRLPGASQPAVKRGADATSAPMHPLRHSPIRRQQPRLGRILLLVGLLIVFAWIFLGSNFLLGIAERGNDVAPRALEPKVGTRGSAAVSAYTAPRPAQIVVGTDKLTVRRIEGAPLSADSGHWDYGPSWIDFNDAGVSDWYSSRLRPLKVASQRPLASDRLVGQGPPYD